MSAAPTTSGETQVRSLVEPMGRICSLLPVLNSPMRALSEFLCAARPHRGRWGGRTDEASRLRSLTALAQTLDLKKKGEVKPRHHDPLQMLALLTNGYDERMRMEKEGKRLEPAR